MLAIYAVTYFHHRKLITCFGFPLIIDIEYSTRLMEHNILSLLFSFAMNNNINISCLFNEGTYILLTVIVCLDHCHTVTDHTIDIACSCVPTFFIIS